MIVTQCAYIAFDDMDEVLIDNIFSKKKIMRDLKIDGRGSLIENHN